MLEPVWADIGLAFIYGSVARGERTATSDIDVLVVGNVSMTELALPLRELERALQIPVNLTHYTAAEFSGKRKQGSHFLQTILRDRKIFLKGSEHELANADSGAEDQDALHEQAGA